jgi:bla regulator protein BlaR1
MMSRHLSEIASTIAPAVANHLWQSTLFAILAALLVLALRRNHARARYWLWLAASLKFLVPFSLLIGLVSHLPWARASAGTQVGLYSAMEQVSQPFKQASAPVVSQAAPLAFTSPSPLSHALPVILTALWFCVLAVVVLVWYLRWQQICVVARQARQLCEGREVQALRRVERLERIRKPIEMRLSRAPLEPGIFGIACPLLLWPEGISERLDDGQLEAILAHEVWHVRRRDNLAAAVHMIVEAIFWFHPLVWWLGARLVEERERACDEGVLATGSERRVYAESILKTCEFCVESPLACLSGVTGADLKKRILQIMTAHHARKLDFSRKLMLSVAGLLAVAAPVVIGVLHATQSRAESQAPNTSQAYEYEVASIKPDKSGTNMVRLMFSPDGLTATNATLQMFIHAAYQVEPHQVSGGPSWLNSDHYDIEAKMDSATADALHKLSEEQGILERQRMLQALLADRFKLTLHRETRELPVYALLIAKNGPKLQEAKPGDTYPNGIKGPDGRAGVGMMFMNGRGSVTGQGLPVSNLVRLLSLQLGRSVVDKTGLTAKYDFTLQWTPDESQGAMFKGPGPGPQGTASPPPPDPSGPSIFTAVQEQLGLKLESQKGPVEILVIDHAEQPSEN